MNKKPRGGKNDKEKPEGEGKRAGNANELQKEMLLEFTKATPELIHTKFSNNVTKESIKKRWLHIEVVLNKVPGDANKSVEQWKRTLRDKLRLIKQKVASNNRSMRQTGGRPPSNIEISPEEDQQLAVLVPKVGAIGNQEIEESSALFMEDESTTLAEDSKDFNDLANLLEDSKDPNILKDEDEHKDTGLEFIRAKELTDDFFLDLNKFDDFKENVGGTIEKYKTEESTPIVIVSIPKTEGSMVQTDASMVKVEPKKALQVSSTETPSIKSETDNCNS